MLFRLVRPMQRSGSRNQYYVRRIPADLRGKIATMKLAIPVGDGRWATPTITAKTDSIRVSLRTADPREVKLRQAKVDAYLESVWQSLRQAEQAEPLALSPREANALSGKLYHAWADERRHTVRTLDLQTFSDTDPTLAPMRAPMRPQDVRPDHVEPGGWASVLKGLESKSTDSTAAVEETLGPLVDEALAAQGIGKVDGASRDRLRDAFGPALSDGIANQKRNAEGDYSPDPKANRFAEWVPPQSSQPGAAPVKGGASLKGLVDAWWVEAKALGRKPSTLESYRNTMAGFVAYLQHDDPQRVTRADVVGFKDHRLATVNPRTNRYISPKTVKDSDLAGLKTLFGWACSNGKMATNPAEGVTLKLRKARKLREKWFTDAEARAILQAAYWLEQDGERAETFAAKRWVPWLEAYSGARIGEMAQLRKEDFRQEGQHWIAAITPLAGTVKTDEARDIVLHPHLVELGFMAFVQAAPAGHLFLRPAADGDILGPLQGVKNRITEFVRTLVSDKEVQPNHGWRHRFKTVGLEMEIAPRVLDEIQGQKPRTVGETYGGVTIKTQAAAMAKFPRYEVEEKHPEA